MDHGDVVFPSPVKPQKANKLLHAKKLIEKAQQQEEMREQLCTNQPHLMPQLPGTWKSMGASSPVCVCVCVCVQEKEHKPCQVIWQNRCLTLRPLFMFTAVLTLEPERCIGASAAVHVNVRQGNSEPEPTGKLSYPKKLEIESWQLWVSV